MLCRCGEFPGPHSALGALLQEPCPGWPQPLELTTPTDLLLIMEHAQMLRCHFPMQLVSVAPVWLALLAHLEACKEVHGARTRGKASGQQPEWGEASALHPGGAAP